MPSTPPSRVTSAASLFLIAIGSLVLVGWTLDIAALKDVFGGITMKANAALGLLASGLALRFLTGWPHSIALGRVFAAIAGLLGALTLSEHLFGWDVGIDQMFFSEKPGATATTSPGRMGPNASLNLTLAGIALWCLTLSRRRGVVTAQFLAACMAALAVVPTVGYLYGAQELYAIARYTGIAVHTGVSFLVLSTGILFARPHVGPVAALMTDAPHGVMARRLLVPAILVPLLLGYIRVFGERLRWFDTGLGVSMFVVVVIILLSVTIWHTALALARSESARQTAEEALTETEQRFRSMADEAPVLIWVEDAGARVWFNRPWYEFTGTAAGAGGWEALVHPDDLPACRAARQEAMRSNARYSHQYRLRRADGRFAWVLETASPRLPARGSHGYVGSCIDVTDMKQAQQDREELLVRERAARETAERADRAKDEFIAALSHELRTPLNAILGWMHMLQHGTLEAASRSKATEVVTRNAGVLARLIEDLLDTSRITTGHLTLSQSPMNLQTAVQAAVDAMSPVAHRKGIEVSIITESQLPPLPGDAQRLQQIVWNLLSNAIKFTPEGGRVEVRLWADPTDVVVSVRDEGEGIDPAFLPHVFDRFRQADSSPTRSQGGLGLGLYIAKSLTELHGGELRAESEGRGRGAIFTIRLPIVADRSRRAPVTTRTSEPAGWDVGSESMHSGSGRRPVAPETRQARELL